jgi:hypothetical protein
MVRYGKKEIVQQPGSLLWGIHMRATTAIKPNSSGTESIILKLGRCCRWDLKTRSTPSKYSDSWYMHGLYVRQFNGFLPLRFLSLFASSNLRTPRS